MPEINDDIPPLNLSELKLRIEHGDPTNDGSHFEVIQELVKYGEAAAPLMPLVAQLHQHGWLKFVPVSDLVALCQNTRSPELLAAIREKNDAAKCNIFEKAELLELGFVELEDELLTYLWANWQNSAWPGRTSVVQALGAAGTRKAHEMLEVIRYQMASRVQDEAVRVQQSGFSEAADEALARVTIIADAAFLERVRQAIHDIELR